MKLYATKTITPEIRAAMPNGFKQFDICECCGFNALSHKKEDNWKQVIFRKRFNLVLCEECTDKKDGTWVYPKGQEGR